MRVRHTAEKRVGEAVVSCVCAFLRLTMDHLSHGGGLPQHPNRHTFAFLKTVKISWLLPRILLFFLQVKSIFGSESCFSASV
jgi:hypothetical protein